MLTPKIYIKQQNITHYITIFIKLKPDMPIRYVYKKMRVYIYQYKFSQFLFLCWFYYTLIRALNCRPSSMTVW